MPPPQYRPLNAATKEIRLLHLEPADDFDDPLVASLQHQSLISDPRPHYETISYVWGDASRRDDLRLDDVVTDFPINSGKALRRLRLENKPRILWMDAICINQQDLDERAQQVSLMADIYSGSLENLIHLGEATHDEFDGIRTALKQVKLINEDVRIWTKNYTSMKGTMAETPSGGGAHGVYPEATFASQRRLSRFIDYDALQTHLFSRSWFNRLWVLQEACLAPRNTCYLAQFQLSLLDIVRCALWIFFHRSFPMHEILQCAGCLHATNMFYLVDKDLGSHQDSRPSLAALMSLSRQLGASDPRDKVYGVLALKFQGQEMPELLKPDYRKSVSDVFRAATRYALFEPGLTGVRVLLEEMCSPTQNELEQPGYISWVLDLTQAGLDESYQLSWFFNCGGTMYTYDLERTRRNPDDSVLELIGFELDTLSDISRTFDSVTSRSVESTHAWLEDALMLLSDSRVTFSTLSEAHFTLGLPGTRRLTRWLEDKKHPLRPSARMVSLHSISSVLTAGVNTDIGFATDLDLQGLLDMGRFILATAAAVPPSLDGPNQVSGSEVLMSVETKRWNRAFRRACAGRRAFRTTRGFIGVGPRLLQPGDVVAVLYGLKYPFILRPRGGTWQILGCCYVEGIMHGEAAVGKFWRRKNAVFRIR